MATPLCYYHPQEQIQSFCLHPSCILPLCPTCLHIHRQDHQVGEHRSLIVSYQQAKSIALDSIEKQEKSILKCQKQFAAQFIEFRTHLLKEVEKALWKIEESYSHSPFDYESFKSQLDNRKMEICKGSLKDLISHYEKGSEWISKDNNDFKYHVDAEKVFAFVDSLCSKEDIVWEQSQVTSRKFESIASEIQSSQTKSQLQICEESRKTDDKQAKQAKTPKADSKFKRKGIFVASSPEAKIRFNSCDNEDKKISKINSSSWSCKKKEEGRNLYNSRALSERNMNQGIKNNENVSTTKKLMRPQSDKRLNINRGNTTKYESFDYRFTNISIDKLKICEGEKSRNLGKVEVLRNENSECKEANWRKVVNTRDVSSNSRSVHNSSSKRMNTLQSLSDQIMNPKQMRELIMKKRMKMGEANGQNRLTLEVENRR